MKKLLTILLTLSVCIMLASCGGQSNNDQSSSIQSAPSSETDQSVDLPAADEDVSSPALPAGTEDLPVVGGDPPPDSSSMSGDEWRVHWLADLESGRYLLYIYHIDDSDVFHIWYREYGDENTYSIRGTYAKKDDGNFVLLSEYGDVFELSVRDREATLTGDTVYGELTFILPDNPPEPFTMLEELDWLEGKIDIS